MAIEHDPNSDPLHAVEASYVEWYERHSEAEQVAKLKGEDGEAERHHAAVLLIVRALTAEGVPT
jgi:hypothetical protein